MARLPMPGIARSSSSVMEDNLLTRLMPLERSALTTQTGILLRASISLEAARGFDAVRAGREAILIPQMIAIDKTGKWLGRFQLLTGACKQFYPAGPDAAALCVPIDVVDNFGDLDKPFAGGIVSLTSREPGRPVRRPPAAPIVGRQNEAFSGCAAEAMGGKVIE
ncbi:hypothetical protein EV128_102349 [Rhizobium azibense]|nr:hypothetical protein EV128_102349 [Rhizobium azibense]